MLSRCGKILLLLALLCSFLKMTALAQQAQQVKLSNKDQKKYDDAFDKARAHYQQFEIYFEKGKNEDAIKELESIKALEFPEAAKDMDGVLLQFDAHILLGEMYIEQSERIKDKKKKTKTLENAVVALQGGLDRDLEVNAKTFQLYYDLYMDLGHAYRMLGNDKKALSAFKNAEKIKEQKQKAQKKSKSG